MVLEGVVAVDDEEEVGLCPCGVGLVGFFTVVVVVVVVVEGT